jgi:hypothetical protein
LAPVVFWICAPPVILPSACPQSFTPYLSPRLPILRIRPNHIRIQCRRDHSRRLASCFARPRCLQRFDNYPWYTGGTSKTRILKGSCCICKPDFDLRCCVCFPWSIQRIQPKFNLYWTLVFIQGSKFLEIWINLQLPLKTGINMTITWSSFHWRGFRLNGSGPTPDGRFGKA